MKTDVFLNVSDHVHLQRLGPHDRPSYVTLARSCTYISDTAFTSRVYILLTTVHMTIHMTTTTVSPLVRATSLWRRRSRAGSTLSPPTTRPATSEGTREHGIQVSQRARPAAKKVAAGSVQPASPRQPRWQASEHGIRSNAGDNIRIQARTFRLCAPFSSSQLLVLVVCA